MVTIWIRIEVEPPIGEEILIANDDGAWNGVAHRIEGGKIQYLRRSSGLGLIPMFPTHWAYPPAKSPDRWLNAPITEGAMYELAKGYAHTSINGEIVDWSDLLMESEQIKTIGQAIQHIKKYSQAVGRKEVAAHLLKLATEDIMI